MHKKEKKTFDIDISFDKSFDDTKGDEIEENRTVKADLIDYDKSFDNEDENEQDSVQEEDNTAKHIDIEKVCIIPFCIKKWILQYHIYRN